MKKITLLFITVCLSLVSTAQDTTVKKAYLDSIKTYTDSLKKVAKAAAVKTAETNTAPYTPKEIATLIIVVAFFLVMILLLLQFFMHLKDHKQRIGYQSIKLIGLILIFPGVCVLALIGGKDILSGETLAVLLGTIAGYVLSREDDNKDNTSAEANKKKEEEYKAKIKQLEEDIKLIKDKNPNLVL